jgi:hypothetical protein
LFDAYRETRCCLFQESIAIGPPPTPRSKVSIYVASAKEARRNFEQNAGSRWHKKDALPTQPDGTLAFQRLRRPLSTPEIAPGFKLHRGDKFFAIGSCFARGIEKALVDQKMEVLSAAPEFASFQAINKNVSGLGFTNKYNTFSICTRHGG